MLKSTKSHTKITMDDRVLVETKDGSYSVFFPLYNETYHSRHGAISESTHVYIDKGLLFKGKETKKLHIFELGIGSGLNAALTAKYQQNSDLEVHYDSIEKHPLPQELWQHLNYKDYVGDYFEGINRLPWGEEQSPWPGFYLHKWQGDIFTDAIPQNKYHLIYFNPFAPSQQPEMWEKPVLQKMYDALVSGGHLLTYSSKSSFRHNLSELGFLVEKLPGPIGKREMVRAQKP